MLTLFGFQLSPLVLQMSVVNRSKRVVLCGRPNIAGNVLGIAEGGEIEAKSFDFAPRLAKTNLYEINLKIKNEYNSLLAVIEAQTLNLVL
jgi:hypothetical protein